MIGDNQEIATVDEDRFDIVKRSEKWSKECREHTKDWRKESKTLYNMVSGDQWTQEEKQQMEDMNRPLVTFNRTGPFVDAISGLQISNRQEVTFYAREPGDVIKHDLLTNAHDWVTDQNESEHEESDAFLDLVICGMGWTEVFMDYEDAQEGMIEDERRDPLEMEWDPSARKRNLSDMRWVHHCKKYPKADAKQRWPNIFDSESEHFDEDEDIHDASEAWRYENDQSDDTGMDEKYIIVKHVQWFERENYYLVATPQGMREVPEEKWLFIKDQVPFRATKMTKKVFYRAVVAGAQLLEEPTVIPEGKFTFRCMTGKRDRNKGTWYGALRGMKDPQRWLNKFFSSILQEIATNGKGLMAEHDAFMDWNSAEEDYADPTRILKLKTGGLQKVTAKPKAEYPMGTDRLMQFASEAFNDVTGVSQELLGLSQINQPGVVEQYRKQSGMTVLSWLFDSLKRYRKEKAGLVVDYIKNYIADGRLIKIVGKEKAQYVPLLRQDLDFKYDIEVDESPTSVNQKERTWAILQSLIPSFAQVGMAPPPEVVDYLPVPQTLIDAWKKAASGNTMKDMQIQQLQQMVQQLQAPERQLYLQGKQIENMHEQVKTQETQSKTVLNQAKAQDLNDDKVVKIAEVNKKAAETGQLL